MKARLRYTTITDPIFGLRVFAFRGTADAVYDAFKRLPPTVRRWAYRNVTRDYLRGVCGTMLHETLDNKRTALFVILTDDSLTEQRDTLLHEVLHVVDYIFAVKGVWKRKEQHGEVLTYYTTWLHRECKKGLGL